jgi:hypothetical protein
MVGQKTKEIIEAMNSWRDHPDYARRMKLREEQNGAKRSSS